MATQEQTILTEEPRYRGEKKKRYEQLIDLREKLFNQYSILYGSNIQTDHHAGEDSADIGSDNFIREMNLNVMSEEGEKLTLIEDALERLAKNKYGKCLDCTKSIEPGRLDALPFAKLCVGCKSVREEGGTPRTASRSSLFDEDELEE